MAYITNADIQSLIGDAAYVELTDDSGSGSADETKVDAARLAAEGEANSYFAVRYRVPIDVSSEPDLAEALRGFVLDLAAYRLHGRRPPVPPDVLRRRDEAVAWLGRVASGDVRLPSALALPENSNVQTFGEAIGPQRTMTRSTLEDI